MRRYKKNDVGDGIATILTIMFAIGLLGGTLLPFEIGKYFAWLFMPPVILVVVVYGIVILRCLFPGLR